MGYVPSLKPDAVVAHLVVFCAAPALDAEHRRDPLLSLPQLALSLRVLAYSTGAPVHRIVLSAHTVDANNIVFKAGVSAARWTTFL
jgi:hypothetical protein